MRHVMLLGFLIAIVPALPAATAEPDELARIKHDYADVLGAGPRASTLRCREPFAELSNAAREVVARQLSESARAALAHAERAAALPRIHSDPFDRMLIAQAEIEGLRLVTSDRVLRRYGTPIVW